MKIMPDRDEIARIRRDALLNRAVEAYKFFYPTVSMILNFDAFTEYGGVPNRSFLIQLTTPDIVTLTQNSDTPYGLACADMTEAGPLVLELPPGPIMGVVDDANFRFVANVGLVGEELGAGAKYLFVPPEWEGEIPDGYIVKRPITNRFLVCVRAPFPDPAKGFALIRTIRLYPLASAEDPPANVFDDVSHRSMVSNPCVVDGTLEYWNALKRAVDADVPSPEFYQAYGMLADLGIRHGRPFAPDDELREILREAAVRANEQLVVTAFADDDPDRLVWPDRRWEWVVHAEGDFGYYEKDFLHLSVRERWFYQATLETDKMFMHREGAGSIYWLGIVDADGEFLDGGRNYRLSIPGPVPATQFWSVTLYDLDTRSEINTPQFTPLLTSLRDDITPDPGGTTVLRFGPDRPEDDGRWVQTNPGSQWFAYFRVYGPTAPAFDGTWKPGDFVIDAPLAD